MNKINISLDQYQTEILMLSLGELAEREKKKYEQNTPEQLQIIKKLFAVLEIMRKVNAEIAKEVKSD